MSVAKQESQNEMAYAARSSAKADGVDGRVCNRHVCCERYSKVVGAELTGLQPMFQSRERGAVIIGFCIL